MPLVGTPARIPMFISAATPRALRRAMLLNNLKVGLEYRYFDIQFVNGKWYAWYLLEEKLSFKTRGGK